MSKKSRFRGPFDKWHGKRTKTLLKSERQHLYHTYWSLWTEFRWKKSLLVICKILGLLFNPLTVVEKCYLLNRGTLFQHFQLQLYKKRKIFSDFFWFFFGFSKLRCIFQHFQGEMAITGELFLNLRTWKDVVREMSKKSRFRPSFDKKDGKQRDTLLKSERQHLYHIYWSLWRIFTLKNSLSEIRKILGLLFNHWLRMTSILFLRKEI